ncbi:N-acetylmuramic acid 6-phosphate etherase [Peribacillus loiseleuriae]|uniref:N-acetylmuramic acid 6-phosphate etherase n=1 Tax=Peribacillus loiseleuriae TaxID=1679170 RepID=A0A0K9GT36_9BACI|nr:N-acetylmuramic acid 6-phosphate etherase [Peribacillus loiseleuriae]KMY49432.1 N-acetylmuramic acid-6-phosphate etherase [Peribacillus loiseleuriae]
MNLNNILTEKRNPNTMNIDELSSIDVIKMINQEDKKVPAAVESILPEIADMVDKIVNSFQNGGRLIYVGAGTSGRLGVLDASECPPTYGTDPSLVVGLIAGGLKALQLAVEGAEDDQEQAIEDIKNLHVSEKDCVIGIAASGRTPYTISAMKQARELGATVGAVICSPHSEMESAADISMFVEAGPEVITGSTRMKAGTAQKLVLNMLTTASMIKIGKVYSNLMVDVQPTNEKLYVRAKAIVVEATGATITDAEDALQKYGSVKTAILSIVTGVEGNNVQETLNKHHGKLKAAIEELMKENTNGN